MEHNKKSVRAIRAAIDVFGLMSFVFVAWLLWTYGWPPANTSTISLFYAADTFDQCDRAPLAPNGPYWVPTSSDIGEVEAALPAMLAGRRRQGLRMPDTTTGSHHQYLGYTLDNKRYIYGNFYPTYDSDELEFHVFEEAVNVCDGGAFFWGVVYDPEAKKFVKMELGGHA